MTISDESPPLEVRSAKSDALGPKSILRVGAWNVRTMFETSKTAQVINEMKRYRLDILGISECRWIGSGRLTTNDGSLILYSGHESTHSHGVAIILSREKARTLMEWEPISERIVKARFDSKYCKLTIIQCYAPTNDAEADVKDDWY
ncbi:craniofacial development protein 2-like [Lingula anatina]|uniref:Craniofacial development protein 2-like n=1 Tax=Lingula anatina TaxID=7574 RepID=A0A1S3H6J3_LINAN|nr:craniofacial development protein 2-like [Lingula anatina]|eukprot:XP_013381618.1 craniofacial development protein 2-like [Lingula anatina]